MSNINELNQCLCDKLDAKCVDGFVELNIPVDAPDTLELDSSWGTSDVSLAPIVQAAQTVTSLELTESALQYNAENDNIDCINGDQLSGIVSLSKLKDVSGTLGDGEAYVWNATQGVFEPFQVRGTGTASDIATLQTQVASLQTQANSLQTAVTQLQEAVAGLSSESAAITELQSQVATLQASVSALQTATAKPSYAPTNAVPVWGTINVMTPEYTDAGLYTHDPTTNVSGDMEFAASDEQS